MTRLYNDPTSFADEALKGFVAANSRYVRRVDGGVVRSTVIPDGQVAVVVGGGSGHYPAFAGLVGPGLASGSACGNMFASPSAGQVYRVARDVERGAGVLLTYGNYAGDVLNFTQAQERLRAEHIDVRTVRVTDDIASAPREEIERRRGVAGDLVVFKVAGAAAEAGYDLDGVERVAIAANARTRSFGVAFSGCSLPGASEPLFTVPEGVMSVGLGIHGEPGISEQPLPSARALAELLVDRLLTERPEGARDEAVVLLNGLGSIKYDELFVLFGDVVDVLTERGVAVLQPECGELVTSLDMAGVSLTLFWPDAELLELWAAPADTPAFRRGAISAPVDTEGHERARGVHQHVAEPEGHRAAASAALSVTQAVRSMLLESEEELGRIDAIAGDGDHGIGMARGIVAATQAAEQAAADGLGIGALLIEAGDAWSEHAGGTSGALWGVALQAAGATLARSASVDETAIADATGAALDAMRALGGAEVGDKTMIDAFAPLVATLSSALERGASLGEAWREAASSASAAAAATADLRPRLGRARPLAEKSIGHPDAGAISLARVAQTIAEAAPAAFARQ
ncbi:dihydroxyacetone kinase family protein [Desertivibrio insolitus]|uniref:dihydroxyacetone kinase family protein n=1 Tax=Herbiconiux sp. SYSU D00978 TaxID=2812562 RepID=UPI001A9651C4|nr:dihydroxyacetone kinase family protein [Herbiconiux sp. SYSU D00978]